MPFLATETLPIPGQDILSWYFSDNPQIKDRDAPIYIDADNPSNYYTHRTAEHAIRHIAAGLRARGLKPGDCVCLHSFNDVNYPILVNGIVAAGCIFAGTNPSYQPYELSHVVKAAKVKFFVVEPEILLNVLVAAKECGIPTENVMIFHNRRGQSCPDGFKSWRSLMQHGEVSWESWDDSQRSKETTVARLFSSALRLTLEGTTGLPKAAILTHYNFIAQHVMVNDYRPKRYTERRLMSLPVFHVAAAPSIHFSPLRNGVRTYLMRRFELKPFLANIARHAISDTPLVPPLVIAIIMNAELTKLPEYSLKSVRFASCGAAPLEKGPQARLRALLGKGKDDPDVVFTQVWGMTETTCIASNFPYPANDTTGSVGKFLPGLDVKLVDDAGADVTGYDVRGELCVRGPTVIPGYYDNPKATAESWDAEGYFHTGDVAYCAKGTGLWYIVDRKKELIKVRGFQVAPPELEAVLLGHEQITDAAVIGVKVKDAGGEDTELPRAYVVRRSDALKEADVKKYMADRLAGYKKLEGGVVFVESIPRNPSGKILKRLLREQAIEEMKQEIWLKAKL